MTATRMHPGLPPLPAGVVTLDKQARHDRTAVATGGHVTWRSWGEGPLLVLLHGGHGSWLHWSSVIGGLAPQHRVLVPDLPGFGESSSLPDDHSIEDTAAALVSGLDSLAPGVPAQLVGFSFGGVVGGHVAAQLGNRARHLTIVGSGGMGLTRPPMPTLRQWRGLQGAELAAAHGENLAILMMADKARIGRTEIDLQHRNTAMARGKSRSFSRTNTLIDILRLARPPVDGIWGQEDATARGYLHERRAALAAVDPAARLVEIPGAGHWVMQENPEAFLAAYRGIVAARGL
ncbi:MAG: alpha/beta fold hydrolase [Pararhodobacter sp.]